jgi:hypothetical protein
MPYPAPSGANSGANFCLTLPPPPRSPRSGPCAAFSSPIAPATGRPYVTKKSVQEVHPKIKDDLASFVRDHPEVLATYKEMASAKGCLTDSELDDQFDEQIFAAVLIERIAEIDPGSGASCG